MKRPYDLLGRRYGTLLVTGSAPRQSGNRVAWWVRCDCGNEKIMRAQVLARGVKSCGEGTCHSMYGKRGADCHNYGRRGEQTGQWRGDAVTYLGAHKRVRSTKGPASRQSCIDCGATAKEWSYDYADENELKEWRDSSFGREGREIAYSANPDHYQARCHPCHVTFDMAHKRRSVCK